MKILAKLLTPKFFRVEHLPSHCVCCDQQNNDSHALDAPEMHAHKQRICPHGPAKIKLIKDKNYASCKTAKYP